MTQFKDHDKDIPSILGGAERFTKKIPFGQNYWPEWEEYEGAFRSLFDRQYYTNHGPLGQQFEKRLEDLLGVAHVVCVTNETIGLSIAAEAMEMSGNIVLPAFSDVGIAHAMVWSNLSPVFCDVIAETHHIDGNAAEKLLQNGATGIVAIDLWGGACDKEHLQHLSTKYSVPLLFASPHSLGSVYRAPTEFFGSAQVFSFHASNILSTAEGGCIATNDDELAERMRNIRSSYGTRKTIQVYRTANGRMSEAQAAVGLLNLDTLSDNIAKNDGIRGAYKKHLVEVPGIRIFEPDYVQKSNNQNFVMEIDEMEFGLTAREMCQALNADNIEAVQAFAVGSHRCEPFVTSSPEFIDALPETDRLCGKSILLPVGNTINDIVASEIGKAVELIQSRAKDIRRHLEM